MQTKVALLPWPTSTKAVPIDCSGVAWNGAAVQPGLAAWAAPGPVTSPNAPTKSATPPIAADATRRLPVTEMVLFKKESFGCGAKEPRGGTAPRSSLVADREGAPPGSIWRQRRLLSENSP